MTSNQMLRILWVRRRLFVRIFLGTVLPIMIISLIWPKSYQGQTSVVVGSKAINIVSGAQEQQSAQLLTSVIATQMDVIASRAVSLKVVDAIKLADLTEFKEKFESDTSGAGSIREWIADYLLKKRLGVTPSKDSSVITITTSARTPQLAADMANAFAAAYIQENLELKAYPARRQAAWFADQLVGLRIALQTAQARLSEHQRTQSVVGTNDQMDIENAKLAEISNQLVTAQTAMYDSQTRLKQLGQAMQRNQVQELPDILGNPLLQSVKGELTRAESNLADVDERFGRNHPQYLSAAAQVESLKRKLAAEISNVKGAINQSAQISTRQVSELQRALAEQRDHILGFKGQHDQLAIFKGEVDNAQKTYDDAFQRASVVKLEGQLDQSDLAVLSVASAPLRASQPKLLLNLVIAIILGTMFGTAAALLLELVSPRVRSSMDLNEISGVKVIAEIPRLVPSTKRNLLWRSPAVFLPRKQSVDT